ncbi:DUF397 domain-containing protein [Streptomyces sp. NPDC102467]|uniref:DUF397 domain-containing protein n=1 Tax=Streptomyces sp. NPDC102467 TaxID=3366179 RepID=UPI0038220F46
MGNTWKPTMTAAWRKSSYSGSSGGDCIECAPLNGATWRKSSYSGNAGGDCLELTATPGGYVALRDSKNPAVGAFTTTPAAFNAFRAAAALGTL